MHHYTKNQWRKYIQVASGDPENRAERAFLHISELHSSPPLGYFIHISITTPVVSALKNYYI